MIEEILPKSIVDNLKFLDKLQEIRLRQNCNLVYLLNGKYCKSNYVVKNDDITYVISKATNKSLYAYEDTIKKGYIAYKGIRIGLAGEGVEMLGKISTIKNISSLCIRVPHVIEFSDQKLKKLIEHFDNTLIISKPGFGKTTLLRDMIKKLSSSLYNILVIDEKGEISLDNTINLSNGADVVINIDKSIAYKHFIKVLRPDIIATDEVFGEEEINSIKDSIRCGVKILATLHANSYSSINQKSYAQLLSMMRYIITLDKFGQITNIYDRK